MTIVQSLWIGEALPEMQQVSVRSFLAHGHDYHLFAYDHVDGVPNGVTLMDASVILPRDTIFAYRTGFGAGSFSAFSNLFRYTLILERGGWWVDTDLVCLRPFAFDDPIVIATEHDDDGSEQCATCAFRWPAGAPVLEYCKGVAEGVDRETLCWGAIGPQLLTSAVRRHALTAHCVPTRTFNPINYFEFEQLVTPGFDAALLADSYAVHLWNQMWKNRQDSAVMTAPPDSLYGELLRTYGAGPSASRSA